MGLSLQKGQSLSLTKQNGESLTNVRMGLGWDSAVPAKKRLLRRDSRTVEIDLDASAILFDATASTWTRSSSTSSPARTAPSGTRATT